jgi:hypothetical protein
MGIKPRYTLRVLFVLVALIAGATAWIVSQIRFVHEREAFRDRLWASHGDFEWVSDKIPTIPWWREWAGDVGVEHIRVPYSCESQFRSDAMRLFPEAQFIVLSQEDMDSEKRDRLNSR